MKKKLIALILGISCMLPMGAAAATGGNDDIILTIGSTAYLENGVQKTMTSAPFVDGNGRTLLPVRAICNLFGISDNQVNWNPETQDVTFTTGKREIKLTVGSNQMINGSQTILMDTQAVNVEGSVYLPMRALLNAFDVTDDRISWNAVEKTITIQGIKTNESMKINPPMIKTYTEALYLTVADLETIDQNWVRENFKKYLNVDVPTDTIVKQSADINKKDGSFTITFHTEKNGIPYNDSMIIKGKNDKITSLYFNPPIYAMLDSFTTKDLLTPSKRAAMQKSVADELDAEYGNKTETIVENFYFDCMDSGKILYKIVATGTKRDFPYVKTYTYDGITGELISTKITH